MPRKPDDQYGYDPERQAAQALLDHLEQQADKRPDKPARQLGDVLKLPKTSPTTKRLLDARAKIINGRADEIVFMHTVLAQCSLPYKPTDERVWIRDQGAASLRIEAGAARHPETGKWVDLPLPHGEKPRLIILHLNSEALRTRSPIIDVERSLTAFVRALEIDTNGRNLRTLRDQLARLAAASIRFGIGSTTIKTDVIDAFDLWWPDDAKQRTLWPSTVQLAPRYFDTLMEHAVPLDKRAIAALAHSALDLDIYTWLAQRLHRVPKGKPQTITWQAVKSQFGPDYDRLRKFRENFVMALNTVLTVYPDAKVDVTEAGLVLRNSSPPVSKRMMQLGKGTVIDVTSTSSKPVD